jgi:hypothetical protein
VQEYLHGLTIQSTQDQSGPSCDAIGGSIDDLFDRGASM